MVKYDSTKDTMEHIKNIQKVFNNVFIPKLIEWSKNHDQSKLSSPEKETYDKYIPELQKTKYGTPEYFEIKDKMNKEGLKHHFEANRHHPEHFTNGINDMTLVDVMEMFCDWYAASLRSDTGFESGLKTNKSKFHMSEQLYDILKNTYEEYLK